MFFRCRYRNRSFKKKKRRDELENHWFRGRCFSLVLVWRHLFKQPVQKKKKKMQIRRATRRRRRVSVWHARDENRYFNFVVLIAPRRWDNVQLFIKVCRWCKREKRVARRRGAGETTPAHLRQKAQENIERLTCAVELVHRWWMVYS